MRSLCCLILLASAALAQNPLTDAFQGRYKSMRQNLVQSAELMPEDAYGFKLTPEQRPFGGWIGHVAMGNYHFCSMIKGEKAPDTSALHDKTAKADLRKAIKESFDYCDAALQRNDRPESARRQGDGRKNRLSGGGHDFARCVHQRTLRKSGRISAKQRHHATFLAQEVTSRRRPDVAGAHATLSRA